MSTFMCNEQNGTAATAHGRVDVHAVLSITSSWDFATKPYGNQRPSGASPG
jgi:hypothetical protein